MEKIKIEFPSLDGLMISANIYEIDKSSPLIVLCHQAMFNKFEYEGIAQKLNEQGFNCIAVDQRSGGPIANQVNETTLRALEKKKGIDYVDAEQDIIATINYVKEKYKGPLILWGSSYSATLAIYIGSNNPKVDAAIAFSPGDYWEDQRGSLTSILKEFSKPLFITSAKMEAEGINKILSEAKLSGNQMYYEPEGMGHHGSRALWEGQIGGAEYWKAITKFLSNLEIA